MTFYELKVDYKNGSNIQISKVEEFVAGYKYLFVRVSDGCTHSFDRAVIREVYRRSSGASDSWIPVALKKSRRSRPAA